MDLIIILVLTLDHVASFRLQARILLGGRSFTIKPDIGCAFFLFCHCTALIMYLCGYVTILTLLVI